MVRYILTTIVVLLVGCAPIGVKITSDNNQIKTPDYSIIVPPNEGWHQKQNESLPDLSYFEKKVPPNIYFMYFSTNWAVDERMKNWTAKQVADNYRNGEEADVLIKGVMKGHFLLKNVVMGDETVGKKHFYTMTYTTIQVGIEQRASLYLYFPMERGFNTFFIALYSEGYPINEVKKKSLKKDFIDTLNSLRMKE